MRFSKPSAPYHSEDCSPDQWKVEESNPEECYPRRFSKTGAIPLQPHLPKDVRVVR